MTSNQSSCCSNYNLLDYQNDSSQLGLNNSPRLFDEIHNSFDICPISDLGSPAKRLGWTWNSCTNLRDCIGHGATCFFIGCLQLYIHHCFRCTVCIIRHWGKIRRIDKNVKRVLFMTGIEGCGNITHKKIIQKSVI